MTGDYRDNGRESRQFDHPVRRGAMLRRRHEAESTAVLMEIVGRFQDLDDDHCEYEIACPTRTGYHQYRAEDLEDCFADTGLTNDGGKAVADDEIRQLYQDLHDDPVLWDVQEEGSPGWYYRYRYCSEDCKEADQFAGTDADRHTEPVLNHRSELEEVHR